MNELSLQLKSLITSIPNSLNYKSVSQFNLVLNKYLRILDYVNSYNPEYKSSTRIFYADITTMRDNVQQILFAQSFEEKEKAFHAAVNELEADIHALSRLIHPHAQLAY